MKINMKSLLSLIAVLASTGLSVVAFASGSAPATLAAGVEVKARQNGPSSNGAPLSNASKGTKVFGADGTATLVSDEKGVVPVAGQITSLEIGALTPGAVPQCYLMVFDSSVAADTTESGSVSRMLVPPFVATTSGNQSRELIYPKQFHKGAVVLVGGTGAASCRASIGWNKIGGAN